MKGEGEVDYIIPTKRLQTCGVIGVCLLFQAGCAASLSPSESGALTGAGMGAAGGAVFGAIAGSAGKGALVGSAVGAVAGLMVGKGIEGEEATGAAPSQDASAPLPSPYTPTLQLDVAPDDTEIIIDGRPVGLAREFYGPARFPVEAGPHFVEFSWRGFSVTQAIVAWPQTTVLVKRDLSLSGSAVPLPASPGVNPQAPH